MAKNPPDPTVLTPTTSAVSETANSAERSGMLPAGTPGVPPAAFGPPNPSAAPDPNAKGTVAQPAAQPPGQTAQAAQPGVSARASEDIKAEAASFNPDQLGEFFDRMAAERGLGNQTLVAESADALPSPYREAASLIAVVRNTGHLDPALGGLFDALPPRQLGDVVKMVAERRITAVGALIPFLRELFTRR